MLRESDDMATNLPSSVGPSSEDADTTSVPEGRPRIVLVVPSTSYRTPDFVAAAAELKIDLVIASDADVPAAVEVGPARTMPIDFDRPEWSAARIAGLTPPPHAIVAADDRGVIIAAMASHLLGLSSNPVSSVSLTRDKAHMRGLLANAGIPQPRYQLAGDGDVVAAAATLGYPCVVKPRALSGSLGVIRVDSHSEASLAEGRIRRIIEAQGGDAQAPLLVEEYIEGIEVAVEGLVSDGAVNVLAILDKPDPLVGPFFEETILVTPSRLRQQVQVEIVDVVEDAVRALGLVMGPIHAEVRYGDQGPVLIEVAARSIGGLCGRALTFGLLGETLETVVLRAALGQEGPRLGLAARATGVMMLPIPRSGILDSLRGIDEALAVEGVTAIEQTIPEGRPAVPLPEGDRYLGFIFAEGKSPDEVETSLRTAFDHMEIRIA